MAEYALFCTLVCTLFRSRNQTFARSLGFAIGLSVLYAISDEWHQTFVPGLGGTWVDVVIDSCGIAIAAVVLVRRATRLANPPSNHEGAR